MEAHRLGLALATLGQLFLFADPQLLRYLVDKYAMRYAEYSPGSFIRGSGLLVLAGVGAAMVARVAKNFQDYVLSVVSTKVGAEIYCDGIHHSLELPYEVFEDQKSGDTLGKLQKVRADAEKFVGVALASFFTTLFGLVFVTMYAFTLHWALAASFFGTIGRPAVLSPRLSQRIKQLQKLVVIETAALAGSTTESLRNIELVKSL